MATKELFSVCPNCGGRDVVFACITDLDSERYGGADDNHRPWGACFKCRTRWPAGHTPGDDKFMLSADALMEFKQVVPRLAEVGMPWDALVGVWNEQEWQARLVAVN